MTVTSTNVSSGPYTGNGTATQFAYTFRILESSQIRVVETDLSGNETVLVEGTNYTVTGAGDAGGGTVVRTAGALPTNFTWLISRDTVIDQQTDLEAQGDFSPDTHEDACDKLTMVAQEVDSRTVDLDASARADRIFSFDSAGVAEANISAPDVRATIAAALDAGTAVTNDTYTGDGSTTVFALSITPVNENALIVAVDGVVQEPVTDYTVSGANVTFVVAPPNNADIAIRNFGYAKGMITGVGRTVATFSNADATPSVAAGNVFKTTGTTAITDFDDGVVGQEIRILATDSITITDGAPINLAGAVNYAMTVDDTLTLCMFDDQVWTEVARSVN